MHSARLAVLAATLLFATAGTVIKTTSWSGFAVAGGRAAVAAVVLLLLMPRWRRFWQPKALVVGAAYGTTMVLFVVANKLTTAANAIFLQSTAPLYLLLLGPWILSEPNRRSDLVLTGTLAIGMALFFVGVPEPVATAPDPALGNALSVTAGVSWALTLVGLRWMSKTSPSEEPVGGSSDLAGASVVAGNIFAFAICVPLAGSAPPLTAPDLGWIAYLGIFQIGFACVLLNRGIQHLRALEVSLLLLLEPVLGTGIAWWVHGEQPDTWALAGCAVIGTTTLARTLLAAKH